MHQRWLRYRLAGPSGPDGPEAFGTLHGDEVHEHHGTLLGDNAPTGRRLALSSVQVLMPAQPSKVIALWNNFGELREKLQLAVPEEPLYLLKSPNSWCAHGDPIPRPRGGGKVAFEGELGIVIGRTCKSVDASQAVSHVFGYTCANDVTAADVLNRDASFAQWCRAKGFDTFCPLGPAIATGLDPAKLRVKTWVDGELRQDYPVSDMRWNVAQLVSRISHDMTLYPGDVILCGTSVGVGSLRPGCRVDVEIAGVGRLSNRFE